MAKKKSDLRSYPSKYPSKVPHSLPDSEWRKERTIELYSYLPQTTLEERATYLDIRDEVVFLNYKFFGYVASGVYLKGRHISYEDKLQSAVTNFYGMWHKFKYGKRYRTDLSFSVFFKQRLSECVYREMQTIKHTTDRSLKMLASDQLGILYSKLRYEDLAKVDLPADKMAALKAIFMANYEDDVDEVGVFLKSNENMSSSIDSIYNDDYNNVVDLLKHEMVERERKLNADDIEEISYMLDIPKNELFDRLEEAEELLHTELINSISCQSAFS